MVLSIYILLNRLFGDVITLQRVKAFLFVVLPVVAAAAIFITAKCAYTTHEINKTADKIDKKEAQIDRANMNAQILEQNQTNINSEGKNANIQIQVTNRDFINSIRRDSGSYSGERTNDRYCERYCTDSSCSEYRKTHECKQ